jgi:hypothetical protein
MRVKLNPVLTLVIIASVVLAISILSIYQVAPSGQRQQSAKEDPLEEKKITSRVKKAKERGEQEVVLYAPQVDYAGSASSTEEILLKYSAVVAKPVEERSYVWDSSQVITWYKFQVVENISQKEYPPCPTCSSIPDEMLPQELLPLKKDEILLSRFGGALTIDGVNVTTVNSDFPPFSTSNKYLLFITVDARGVAGTAGGPATLFTANADDTLEPLSKRPHSIKRDVDDRFGRSLRGLREYFRKQGVSQ